MSLMVPTCRYGFIMSARKIYSCQAGIPSSSSVLSLLLLLVVLLSCLYGLSNDTLATVSFDFLHLPQHREPSVRDLQKKDREMRSLLCCHSGSDLVLLDLVLLRSSAIMAALTFTDPFWLNEYVSKPT